jgi:hypothetical protein
MVLFFNNCTNRNRTNTSLKVYLVTAEVKQIVIGGQGC